MPRKSTSNEKSKPVANEIGRIAKGLVYAQIEGVEATAKALRQVWDDALDREDSGERTRGGKRRKRTDESAQKIADIPRQMIDTFYAEYDADDDDTTEEKSVRDSGGLSNDKVVCEAREYLRKLPGRGATLKGLIDHVVLQTDCNEENARSLIRRHFVVKGNVVRDQTRVARDNEEDIEGRMSRILKQLGYNVRTNVRLTTFEDLSEEAGVVGFDGEVPTVLCYATTGDIDDILVREAASFQAHAIKTDQPAKYVWVSDGIADFFLDIQNDRAIDALPHATEKRA